MADHRYHRGKIYAIRSPKTDLVYIGSTIGRLSERLFTHKANLKQYITGGYHYLTSYEITKFEDCYIELIEEFRCESKAELNRREGEIIRATENCVNKYIAGRTHAEYRHDNREKLLAKMKQYHQDNRGDILAKKNEKYYCPCSGKYTLVNRSTHFRTKKHLKYTKSYNK